MDLSYFVRERTAIIRLFYDKGRVPFEQLKRDIEEEVPPWEPPPVDPDTYNGEPAYLEEFMRAEQTRELVGMMAVTLLSDTLKLYFAELERELRIRFVDPKERTALFKLGVVEAYRQILQQIMGDRFASCPVRFDVIEQVVLARNDLAHPAQPEDAREAPKSFLRVRVRRRRGRRCCARLWHEDRGEPREAHGSH